MLKELLGVVLAVVLIDAKDIPRCEHITIAGQAYRKQLLAAIDGFPTDLAVDPRNGNIFFMLHKRNFTRGLHILQYGSLGIKKVPISDEISSQCVAIDAVNNVVYIGTNQGIANYDYSQSEITGERTFGDDDVKSIFIEKHTNHMYITTGAQREIYKVLNGTANVKRYERVPRAYNFVIDSKSNVFFEYIDGKLYFFAANLFEPVQYAGFTRDLTHILSMDEQGTAYVAVKGSIYKLTVDSILPQWVGQLDFKITGLTFDSRNNMYVGTKGKLIRLKMVDNNEPCPSEDYFYGTL